MITDIHFKVVKEFWKLTSIIGKYVLGSVMVFKWSHGVWLRFFYKLLFNINAESCSHVINKL